jgi:hypothetical protein
VTVGSPQVLIGSTVSLFSIDDAIVGLAQPLTEAPNQLASARRRAHDLIEKLSWAEKFCLDLTGGSNGRAARSVFYDAHLPDRLPSTDHAKKDQIAIEFSHHVDKPTDEEKDTIRWITLAEEDLAFGEMHAGHCSPFNLQRGPERGMERAAVLSAPFETTRLS